MAVVSFALDSEEWWSIRSLPTTLDGKSELSADLCSAPGIVVASSSLGFHIVELYDSSIVISSCSLRVCATRCTLV